MTAIGLMIEGHAGLTWERWRRLLDAAEALGYDSVFCADHYAIGAPQESLDAWLTLFYAAEHTRRIEFGPLVSPVTFRHPVLTARMALEIDNLSGGRLVYGMGAGWNAVEHQQFGVPFPDPKTRADMLEEAVALTTRLFQSDAPVSYQGQHYRLDNAQLLPRPARVGGPSILIGGHGKTRTLPLAAKYANEWNVPHLPAATIRGLNDYLTELLIAEGREPGQVKRSLMTQVIFGRTDAEVRARVQRMGDSETKIIGTPTQIVDCIGTYVAAGIERFMLLWADHDDIDGLEQMARDVLPHFHNAP